MVQIIKQYGLPGTGTNQLRLILQDSGGIEVLMHILGDKAQGPSGAMMNADTSLEPLEFVKRATLELRAPTTNLSDSSQLDWLRGIADDVHAAVLGNTLKFVVSVRDPYSWIHQTLKATNMLPSINDKGTHQPVTLLQKQLVVSACRLYNECYGQWLLFRDSKPQSVQFVRFETLLRNSAILPGLERFLSTRLARVDPKEQWATRAAWDHLPTSTTPQPDYVQSYVDQSYLSELGLDAIELVTRSIEWPRLSDFGYLPISNGTQVSRRIQSAGSGPGWQKCERTKSSPLSPLYSLPITIR